MKRLLALALLLLPIALPAQDEAKPPKVPVVDFKRILPLLPAPLPGWEAKKPEGNTLRMGPVELTNVDAEYTKGESRAKIHIIDYAVQPDVMKGLSTAWQFSNESTEGYAKTVKVDGLTGYETWNEAGKQLNLFLICAERFWVHVEVEGEAPEVARAWARKIDLKALAALK